MPKQKSKKAIQKRFKITKTGKVLRGQSFTGHLNTKKSKKKKRNLSGLKEVDPFHSKRIKKFTGNVGKQNVNVSMNTRRTTHK